MIRIEVLGAPAPKGSSRAVLIRGRALNIPSGTDANKRNLRAWDVNVRDTALAVVGQRSEPVFVNRPLSVTLEFRLTRPAGHWGKRGLKPSAPSAPQGKPDADKLARATLDSLTGLVFDDDARIVQLTVAKVYAAPGHEGARITVEEWRLT